MKNKNAFLKKKNILWLLLTVLVSLVLLIIYRVCLNFQFFEYVLFSYMIALTALVLVYIFYNRGFSRKGVTTDMLPESWSEDKKTEFVRSAGERMKKSKWMLVFIIAFLFTFFVDSVELFILPFFKSWF